MRQPNVCSTPAPRSTAAKQWFEDLTQSTENKSIAQEDAAVSHCDFYLLQPFDCIKLPPIIFKDSL